MRIAINVFDGRRQEPSDYDFHVTPGIVFATGRHERAEGFAVAVVWGFWALSLGVMWPRKKSTK